MGSLDGGSSFKRDSLLRSSSSTSRTDKSPFLQRQRSRCSRFFLFKKLDYVQWICTVGVFLFFVVLFQMYLPGSVIERSIKTLKDEELSSGDLMYLNEYGILDFGEDVIFEPLKILEKFKKETREVNPSNAFNRTRLRYPHRKPQLALVRFSILFFLLLYFCFKLVLFQKWVYFYLLVIGFFGSGLCQYVTICLISILYLKGFCRSLS